MQTCTVTGCEQAHIAQGFCTLHYQRWKRHGDPEKLLHRTVCSVDGCSDKHKSNGLCNKHQQAAYRAARGRASERESAFRRAHGMSEGEWQALWDAQQGLCYLCQEPMGPRGNGWRAAVVDHDHSCCPRKRSCPKCRRGLACGRCNRITGLLGDNADLLRRIAENFGKVVT